MLPSMSSSFHLKMYLVAGMSLWSFWSGVEGASSSILISLMLEILRLSRSDLSEFRRASGVEGATGAAAKGGVGEGERPQACAAWSQTVSLSLGWAAEALGPRPRVLGKTSRMRGRMEGRLWVSREGGGLDYSTVQ